MAIGVDRDERHFAALSRLGTGDNALRGDNHIVPVLKEIVHEDTTFVVFPLMASGFDYPWYYHFSEVLNAVEQILEGLRFCHEQLVAHQVRTPPPSTNSSLKFNRISTVTTSLSIGLEGDASPQSPQLT